MSLKEQGAVVHFDQSIGRRVRDIEERLEATLRAKIRKMQLFQLCTKVFWQPKRNSLIFFSNKTSNKNVINLKITLTLHFKNHKSYQSPRRGKIIISKHRGNLIENKYQNLPTKFRSIKKQSQSLSKIRQCYRSKRRSWRRSTPTLLCKCINPSKILCKSSTIN